MPTFKNPLTEKGFASFWKAEIKYPNLFALNLMRPTLSEDGRTLTGSIKFDALDMISKINDSAYQSSSPGQSDGGSKWETGRWRPETEGLPTWYEIPYRSIVPEGAENVLAPGRMLDCARDAYGASRVMVNCNQMGEAAGVAAVRPLKEGLPAAKAGPSVKSV